MLKPDLEFLFTVFLLHKTCNSFQPSVFFIEPGHWSWISGTTGSIHLYVRRRGAVVSPSLIMLLARLFNAKEVMVRLENKIDKRNFIEWTRQTELNKLDSKWPQASNKKLESSSSFIYDLEKFTVQFLRRIPRKFSYHNFCMSLPRVWHSLTNWVEDVFKWYKLVIKEDLLSRRGACGECSASWQLDTKIAYLLPLVSESEK